MTMVRLRNNNRGSSSGSSNGGGAVSIMILLVVSLGSFFAGTLFSLQASFGTASLSSCPSETEIHAMVARRVKEGAYANHRSGKTQCGSKCGMQGNVIDLALLNRPLLLYCYRLHGLVTLSRSYYYG
jgi:hypothetical protein